MRREGRNVRVSVAALVLLAACAAAACAAAPRELAAEARKSPFQRTCIEACKADDADCALDCALDLKKWVEAPSQSVWCHRKGFGCTDTPGKRVEWLGGVRAGGTTWERR